MGKSTGIGSRKPTGPNEIKFKIGSRGLAQALLYSLLLACAVNQKPTGGPEDKAPPAIAVISPMPGSTRIPPDAKFEIVFTKPMNHDATEGSVFLSPVFWEYPKMQWSGKKLTILPPENLQPDKTYILTIGAGATDYRNNKMAKSQSFAFSTGESIDSCSIAGHVFFEEKPGATYDIWAYEFGDADSLKFLSRIPDYVTQIDSVGRFSLEHLSPGVFMILAVEDKNDDLFWDPQSESIGLPSGILTIEKNASLKNLSIRPIRRDTSLACISKASPIDRNKVALELSQPLNEIASNSLNSFGIFSDDSLNAELRVLGSYTGESGALTLEIENLMEGKKYKIIPRDLKSIWGNSFDTAGIAFSGVSYQDTAGPRLIKSNPMTNSRGVQSDSVVELIFNERIKTEGISHNIFVIADSLDTLGFIPSLMRPNLLILRFPSRIPRERIINVVIKADRITDAFNNPSLDSINVISFRIAPADTFGTVLANIVSTGGFSIIGNLRAWSGGTPIYESVANNKGEITFPAVFPGDYKFSYFVDEDSDRTWSPGNINPFRSAEFFDFIPDTVTVRSRWQTDIGRIEIGK